MKEVETFVSCRQNKLSQFIVIRPIMELCMATEWRLGSRVTKRWWDQEGLYVERIRMASQEEDQTEGEGRDGRDRDGDRLSQWEDNAAKVFLGTEPNAPLYYAMGLEH